MSELKKSLVAEETPTPKTSISSLATKPEPTFYQKWLKECREDAVGVSLAMCLFVMCVIISACGQNMNRGYQHTQQWPLGGLAVAISVIYGTHYMMEKPINIGGYSFILILVVIPKAISDYEVLQKAGMNAPLWAVLIGCCVRYCIERSKAQQKEKAAQIEKAKRAAEEASSPTELTRIVDVETPVHSPIAPVTIKDPPKLAPTIASPASASKPDELLAGTLGGEFFVKMGVALMAMDFYSVIDLGGPGLVVSWVDTILVFSTGIFLCYRFGGFDLKDAIVIAGGTSICGSSAAQSLSSSMHEPGYNDKVAKDLIAIMGVFNTPLMPLLPLVFAPLFGINQLVEGAWIGGSIDSTGQVTASGELGGDKVLATAIIIKMTQNLFIIVACMVVTAYFSKSMKLDVIILKFPLFVVGFLITSTVATIFIRSPRTTDALRDNIVDNSWCVSEWLTLIGFAKIGLEIDIYGMFFGNHDASFFKVLKMYGCIQLMDVFTTFAFAYAMFANRTVNDDTDDGNN